MSIIDWAKFDGNNVYIRPVRCRECQFFNEQKSSGLKGYCYCEIYKGYKHKDGFCDLAERREEDD